MINGKNFFTLIYLFSLLPKLCYLKQKKNIYHLVMDNKISLDKFCDILVKINLDFTDYILEDWESEETGNTKLEGLTEKEWLNLYINYIKKER